MVVYFVVGGLFGLVNGVVGLCWVCCLDGWVVGCIGVWGDASVLSVICHFVWVCWCFIVLLLLVDVGC